MPLSNTPDWLRDRLQSQSEQIATHEQCALGTSKIQGMGQENREGRQTEGGGSPSLLDKWKFHSWAFKNALLEGGVIFPLPDLASVTFLK